MVSGNVLKTNSTFLRESTIMKLHYITGLGALFVVAVHVLMRLVMPFSMSLEYQNVVENYRILWYALLLESILVLISIHGFNGLRIMLIELRQNGKWERFVTIFTLAAMLVVLIYGTRTIIIANNLGL
ncbi:MAG: succinate dehydrogenase [Thermoproteota archaeon]|jgi:succinate dehydrogenase / fumarate reductase membrane anchor subunit|nr:succinate dehydrogenase [Thermoproteota archaeon]